MVQINMRLGVLVTLDPWYSINNIEYALSRDLSSHNRLYIGESSHKGHKSCDEGDEDCKDIFRIIGLSCLRVDPLFLHEYASEEESVGVVHEDRHLHN